MKLIDKIIKANSTGTNKCITFSEYYHDNDGYLKVLAKPASRAVWESMVGPIPAGLVIRHKCRTRACVNIKRLEPGTKLENNRDRYRDGTDFTGTKNPSAKLDEFKVREIKQRIANGEERIRDIAKDYQVCENTVHHIKSGRTWDHVK